METLREAFLAKFPRNQKVLQYYEEANGCECTWESLSKIRLHRYVTYLSTKLSPNGVKTYCSKLKSVLSTYNEEIDLPKDYGKVLQVRTDASQHVYLNEAEIHKIIDYPPRTKAEHIIKNWFLIGCLTGARHSDYITFTPMNIQEGELRYVSIKTHHDTVVPLSLYAEGLIREDDEKGYNEIHYSDVYFNRILKRICKNAGINALVSLYCSGKFSQGEKWQYVASHCARRSFATNLYRNKVDIYTISRLCGHSSVEMTKKYICCGPQIDDNVLQYFNNFQ